MTERLINAKALAERLRARMENPFTAPSFYRAEADVWQAGYRYGLGQARTEIGLLVQEDMAAEAPAFNDKHEPEEA